MRDVQEMLQRRPLCYIQIEPDKTQSRRMKSRSTLRERGKVAMDEIESEAQSFIIRVWSKNVPKEEVIVCGVATSLMCTVADASI
jgi:hypothetical protein